MGSATIIIVTPLPSGVIAAPNKRIAIEASLQCFLQKSGPTTPRTDRPYMTTGSSNATPNARLERRTKSRNSSSSRNGWAPMATAMLYRKENVRGRMTKKAIATPERKRRTTGRETRTISRRSFGFSAGATNRQNSYVEIGDVTTSARNRAILNWTSTGAHGVRTTGITDVGRSQALTARKNCWAIPSWKFSEGRGSHPEKPNRETRWKLNVRKKTNETRNAYMTTLNRDRSSSMCAKKPISGLLPPFGSLPRATAAATGPPLYGLSPMARRQNE